MGNKISFPTDKRIVVVGAGYGGVALGNQLKGASANFLLIDQRDAMHHNLAAVRAVAIPGFVNKTMIPFKPTFGDNFKQGKVVNINPPEKKVTLASGETISYDKLVISTGTTGPFPVKMQAQSSKEASAMYDNVAQKVKNSKSIVVVGGGAAGVELAGEIAAENPDTKVTLIHSHTDLVSYPNVTKDFQDTLVKKLTDMKINLVLGEKVQNLDAVKEGGYAGTITTDKGNSFTADCIFKATGLHIQKDAYCNSPLSSSMLPNGALKVNKFLQVEGQDDIFAMGDCNNTPENKLAMASEAQANVVATNIANSFNKQALVEHKPGLAMAIVLALSRTVGMAQLAGGRIMPEMMANKMKAPDCSTASYWKKFGQTPPK